MLTATLILERFNKDHRLLERRELPSRSFVKNFIGLLYCAHAQIQQGAPYSMQDITNTARNVDGQCDPNYYSKSNLRIAAAPGPAGEFCTSGTYSMANLDYYLMLKGDQIGIQVGTGVGAVTPTDVALGTRIAHGSAAGQLEYGGCELLSIAFADPNGQFTIRRYFSNNSGGAITVQEVGIYSVGTKYTYGAWYFLIARDLTGAIAVANTELLRVTYVVQITV